MPRQRFRLGLLEGPPGVAARRPCTGAVVTAPSYQPPPPPPPDEPPLLELLLLEPLDVLEDGGDTLAAMPLAAACQEAPPPAPPDPPPLKPVHCPSDDGEDEYEEEDDEPITPPRDVVALGARLADQSSTCLPSSNASSHGYHSSRSAGRSLRSSSMKKARPAVNVLRNATASRRRRELKAWTDELMQARAIATRPTTVRGWSSTATARNQR